MRRKEVRTPYRAIVDHIVLSMLCSAEALHVATYALYSASQCSSPILYFIVQFQCSFYGANTLLKSVFPWLDLLVRSSSFAHWQHRFVIKTLFPVLGSRGRNMSNSLHFCMLHQLRRSSVCCCETKTYQWRLIAHLMYESQTGEVSSCLSASFSMLFFKTGRRIQCLLQRMDRSLCANGIKAYLLFSIPYVCWDFLESGVVLICSIWGNRHYMFMCHVHVDLNSDKLIKERK